MYNTYSLILYWIVLKLHREISLKEKIIVVQGLGDNPEVRT